MPASPLTRNCIVSTSASCCSTSGPGGLKSSVRARICSCCSRSPSTFARSSSSLIPGVVSLVVQLAPQLRRLGRDAVDILDVALVRRLLLVTAAVVDDEDEDDREQDRAGDEHPEPVEPRPAGGPGRPLREPGPLPGRRAPSPASSRRSATRRRSRIRYRSEGRFSRGRTRSIRVEGVAESTTRSRTLQDFPDRAPRADYQRCRQPSRSPRTTSSSAGTGRSGRSAAAAAARSGWRATSTPAATSR